MPEDIPLPGAAALYFPFHLAWLGLFDRAELQAGESVLIHAAAGGAGSAAIQLARSAGRPRLRDRRDRREGAAVPSTSAPTSPSTTTTEDFAEIVLAETGNRGVDVVFDNVGEAVMEKSMSLHRLQRPLPDDGLRLEQGGGRRALRRARAASPLGNFKLCGVLLNYAGDDMIEMMKTAHGLERRPDGAGRPNHGEIVELVRSGAVRPVIGSTVGFEELPALIDDMANRGPPAAPSSPSRKSRDLSGHLPGEREHGFHALVGEVCGGVEHQRASPVDHVDPAGAAELRSSRGHTS